MHTNRLPLRVLGAAILIGLSTLVLPIQPAAAQSPAQDSALSGLEELLSIEISSSMKYERQAADIPASVAIITSDDIARYGFRTPLEAIATISGFYTSYDRNYYYVGVRGFGRPTDYNNRLLLLIDGHALNDNYYNSAMVGGEIPLPMDAVERIEVTRGPGSALYGTGAMFAVVNIVTKDARSLDGLVSRVGAGPYGEVTGSAIWTHPVGVDGSLSLAGTVSRMDGQSLYFPAYDDLTSNYGVSERLDWEKNHSVLGRLSLGEWKINALYSNRWKGIPTGAWGTIFNDDDARTLDRRAYAEALYERGLRPGLKGTARLAYDHYYYVGFYPYEETLNQDANWGHSLAGELQLIWDPRPDNRVVIGAVRQENITARYKYWDDPGPVYFDDNVPYATTSVFAQDEFQVRHNLALVAGVRYDHSTIAPSSTTPRLGAVYHPTATTTLKALYGEAFRTPSNYELFWDNSNLGFRGNPALSSEQIHTRELVLEQRLSRWLQTNLSVYDYDMQGLIDFVTDPVDSTQVYQNTGAVEASGVELGLQARLPGASAAFVSYSYQDAHDADDNDLTNSPYQIAVAGLSVPVRRTLLVGALVRGESERTTVYETKTAGFITVDVNMRLTPRWAWLTGSDGSIGTTAIDVRITNLLDADYANPGGYEHMFDAIPQDGRRIRATLSVQL